MPCVCPLVKSEVASVCLTVPVSLENLNGDDCDEKRPVCPGDTLSVVSVDLCVVDWEPIAAVECLVGRDLEVWLEVAVNITDTDPLPDPLPDSLPDPLSDPLSGPFPPPHPDFDVDLISPCVVACRVVVVPLIDFVVSLDKISVSPDPVGSSLAVCERVVKVIDAVGLLEDSRVTADVDVSGVGVLVISDVPMLYVLWTTPAPVQNK